MRALMLLMSLLTLVWTPPAVAAPLELPTELPDVKLERIPPSFSYDFGVQFGVGEVTWWREDIPVWANIGFFGVWGAHLKSGDRIGPGLAFIAEGDIPLHTTLALEPTLRWDRVQGKLGLGASLGVAGMYHIADKPSGVDRAVSAAPVLAARIGWSQGFTRVGRRVFVLAEPKIRYMLGRFSPSIAVTIGAGKGY